LAYFKKKLRLVSEVIDMENEKGLLDSYRVL